MMKLLSLFLFAMLIAAVGHAQQKETAELVTAVVTANESLNQAKEAGKISLSCNASIGEAERIVLSPHFNLRGIKDCIQFIKPDGTYGPWGNSIIETIAKLPKDEVEKSFYSNDIPDMDFICPKFKKFGSTVKLKFWVWTFSAIAWQESSCNPRVIGSGQRTRAIGLLQLEESRILRKSRGSNCNVPSVNDPKNNLACGVEILHQQLLGPQSSYFGGLATGELFWKSTYWRHLRLKDNGQPQQELLTQKIQEQELPKNTSIKELIMRFPYCQ